MATETTAGDPAGPGQPPEGSPDVVDSPVTAPVADLLEGTVADLGESDALPSGAEPPAAGAAEIVPAAIVPAARRLTLPSAPRAKRIAKRTLAVLTIIVAALVLIIAISGIIGSWAVNAPVTDTILKVLAPVGNALDLADQGLTRLDNNLTETVQMLDAVNTIVNKLASELKDAGSFVSIAQTVVSSVLGDGGASGRPRVQQVLTSMATVREGIGSVRGILDAVGSLPFVNLKSLRPETPLLDRLTTQIDSVGQSMTDFQTNVQSEKADRIDLAQTRITTRLGQVLTIAQQAQTTVSTYRTTVEDLQVRLANLKGRVPLIVDLISLFFTAIFGWLAFCQVVVLRRAWAYFKAAGA